MELVKKDDPVTLAKYAVEEVLIYQNLWKCGKRYTRNTKILHIIYHNLLKAKKKREAKFQFGVRFPRTAKEDYKFDKINGGGCGKSEQKKK